MSGLRIGITGGVASGKTAVTERFIALGVPVVDADVIARELTADGQPMVNVLAQALGEQILHVNGGLNRRALRERIFHHTQDRQILENLLHPPIVARLEEQANALLAAGHAYCLLSIPLLIEKALYSLVERIVVVDCELDTQYQRLMTRDHISREQAEKMLHAQVDRQIRLGKADDVIYNNASWEALEQQIAKLHRYYTQLALRKANSSLGR